MADRIIIVALIGLAIAAGWGAVLLWRWRRVQQLREEILLSDLVPLGRPAVVAFSAPGCAECYTRQLPALERLRAALGDTVTVCTVSALEYSDLVRRIGILTVPSSVVVDPQGAIKQLNLGYASDVRLRDQILSLQHR